MYVLTISVLINIYICYVMLVKDKGAIVAPVAAMFNPTKGIQEMSVLSKLVATLFHDFMLSNCYWLLRSDKFYKFQFTYLYILVCVYGSCYLEAFLCVYRYVYVHKYGLLCICFTTLASFLPNRLKGVLLINIVYYFEVVKLIMA